MAVSASLPALADYPLISHKYTADPWAISWNGRIYMYCSHDTYSPERGYGYFMNDVTLISSSDLKNWTDHGEVYSTRQIGWGAKNTWAPCVVERGGKFYLYYGDANAGGIGVAVADSPVGPFREANDRPMITLDTPGVLRDADGKPYPDNQPGTPGALPGAETWGFWCFDPCVFIDDDGQAYMYFGGSHPNNSRIIRLKDNLTEVDGAAVKANTPGFFEASAMHKYKGRYYYSYSGFGFGYPTRIEYVTSRKPMSGFSSPGIVQEQPRANDEFNNHHCIFQHGDHWYLAYHNRQVAYENGEPDKVSREFMRSVCLDRLYYNEKDGSIIPVESTRDGLPQLHNVDAFAWNEAETMARGKGIKTVAVDGDRYGNRAVEPTEENAYVKVRGVEMADSARRFTARVSTPFDHAGTVELHLEAPDGLLVGSMPLPGDAKGGQWQELTATVSPFRGIYDLYIVFKTNGKQQLKMDRWKFEK